LSSSYARSTGKDRHRPRDHPGGQRRRCAQAGTRGATDRQEYRPQRAGLSEWRKLYVDQAPSPIDLQIPGAPLTLRTGIREIAELFGISRSTIRVTIVSRKEPDGYAASISLANDHSVQATCQMDQAAVVMDKLFECIALKAMTLIDPKIAATYVFQDEEQRCGSLDAG
jgi:hypothetical protein